MSKKIKFIKPARKVTKVFLHHSASDLAEHDNPGIIEDWHLKRGFNSIGYHFFISKDGLVHPGRSLEVIPAAQKGFNTGSIAICLSGLKQFTDNQKDSLIELCEQIQDAYDQKISFHGHKEVNPSECPNYPYKKWLWLDEFGFIKKKTKIFKSVLSFVAQVLGAKFINENF